MSENGGVEEVVAKRKFVGGGRFALLHRFASGQTLSTAPIISLHRSGKFAAFDGLISDEYNGIVIGANARAAYQAPDPATLWKAIQTADHIVPSDLPDRRPGRNVMDAVSPGYLVALNDEFQKVYGVTHSGVKTVTGPANAPQVIGITKGVIAIRQDAFLKLIADNTDLLPGLDMPTMQTKVTDFGDWEANVAAARENGGPQKSTREYPNDDGSRDIRTDFAFPRGKQSEVVTTEIAESTGNAVNSLDTVLVGELNRGQLSGNAAQAQAQMNQRRGNRSGARRPLVA